jgi:hypothetical protein
MKTITLSILDSEEESVMRQLHEWQQRKAVRFEAIDSLLFPGEPLTPGEWEEELRQTVDSGSVMLTKTEALSRFGL